MKDKDVIKMVSRWVDKLIERPQSARPMFPNATNFIKQGKRPRKPSAKQLKALEEGRKILLMKQRGRQG